MSTITFSRPSSGVFQIGGPHLCPTETSPDPIDEAVFAFERRCAEALGDGLANIGRNFLREDQVSARK